MSSLRAADDASTPAEPSDDEDIDFGDPAERAAFEGRAEGAPVFGEPGWADHALEQALARAEAMPRPRLSVLDEIEDSREQPGWEPDPVWAPPTPQRVSELAERPPGGEWIVEGFLRRGALAMIAATPGVGKSFSRVELAVRVAAGRGALFEHYSITHAANVLTVDEDNGEREEWDRETAVCRALSIERAELDRYRRVSWTGLDLADPQWQSWLEETVDRLEIDLLILDPVSEMYAVREVREELKPVKDFLRRLLRRRPTMAILLVHHLKKIGANGRPHERGIDDVRGGEWGQACDVIALMMPMGERRVRVEMHKRTSPSSVILEQSEAGPFVFVADASTGARKATNDERVLACIDAGAATAEEVHAATSLPVRTVYAAIRRLRNQAILTASGPYRRLHEEPT